jgi:hypothetical protein
MFESTRNGTWVETSEIIWDKMRKRISTIREEIKGEKVIIVSMAGRMC